MVDPYASEQETVDQIKRWWKENGTSLIVGLALGVGGLAGYRYWDSAQIARAESASINYTHFLQLAADKDADALAAGQTILDNYGDSTYAKLTALFLAKLAVDTGDYESGKDRLQWLLDNSQAGEINYIARARLARILLAENDAEVAIRMIEAVPEIDGNPRFAELRGDILSARGDLHGARSMYLQALTDAREQGANPESVQIKIDNLGVVEGRSDS